MLDLPGSALPHLAACLFPENCLLELRVGVMPSACTEDAELGDSSPRR